MLPYIRKRFNKVISFAAKERRCMKEEELEDLGKGECYVLSPYEDKWDKREYLLRTGEIVKGIKTSYKDTVVAWVNVDMDTYLGIGVIHE